MVTWDPDGAGPLTPRIVCGGSFTVAGGVPAAGIAMLDPATNRFTPLATSIDGNIDDMVVLPSNELAVAGNFRRIDGVAAAGVATFNGATWTGLATSLSGGSGFVSALAVLPSGVLVIGGSFNAINGVAANNIAQFNGASWAPLAGGVDAGVSALAVRANGTLVVGGHFTTAFQTFGSLPVGRIAQFQGGSWSALGTGVSFFGGLLPASVTSIVEVGNLLVVGGNFALAGGQPAGNLAYFGIGGWSAPAQFLGAPVSRLRVTAPGTVAVCGSFTQIGALQAAGIALLVPGTTSVFTPLGTGLGGKRYSLATDVVAFGNDLFVGGSFAVAGAVSACDIARFSAGAWNAIGGGRGLRGDPAWTTQPFAQVDNSPQVRAIGTFAGNTIVGGTFANADGGPLESIAEWNGSSFLPLGPGLNGRVATLTTMSNGNLFAGGSFTAAGTVVARAAATWNGTTWREVGGGITGTVECAITLANGDLVVGGSFSMAGGVPANNVALFDGSSWRPLGAGLPGTVFALAEMPNGLLVAGGSFLMGGTGDNLAMFGGVWRTVDSGTDAPVRALRLRPDGRLLVGGLFTRVGATPAGGLALWDGNNLTGFADTDGSVFALEFTSSGNLVVGGVFQRVNGVRARNLAIFDGSQFRALGSGANRIVRALRLTGAERLGVGGDFSLLDDLANHRFGELVTSCAASSTGIGAGCGSTTLAPLSLPQIGTNYRALAAGMPPLVIATTVLGASQIAVPLQTAFPVAAPNCTVFASPDILDSQLVVGGSQEVGFAIPLTPAFVGANWFFQLIALELDANGAVVGATSSNAFRLTVGAF